MRFLLIYEGERGRGLNIKFDLRAILHINIFIPNLVALAIKLVSNINAIV